MKMVSQDIHGEYLAQSECIDWAHPAVLSKARELAKGHDSSLGIARSCFEFVRDAIRHSGDFQLNPVTCKASEVLEHATGYCYAKSHLLAALLRANGIPAGLCYQRLSANNDGSRFCLHGLNAVFLDTYGWYRIDARGNKPGITTVFDPPTECLAFIPDGKGEANLEEIWAEPLPVVVRTLTSSRTYMDVDQNLPDVDLVREHR